MKAKRKPVWRSFFDRLSEEQKSSIRAVCIDRNGAYRSVLSERLPEAEIVYDKFHLMANMNKALDQVRRQEVKRARAENNSHYELLKGQRYHLLKHPENLKKEQAVKLKNLLAINEKLNTVYLLKDHFRRVWDYRETGRAKIYLKQWTTWAKDSSLPPVIRFAKGVERDADKITSWCKHRITNGRIEGFNSIISRILFKSRGIRSLSYLYLKLRQESLLQI